MTTLSLQDWAESLRRAASELVRPAIEKTLVEASLVAEDRAKRLLSGRTLKVRTGHLRRSLASFVRHDGDVIEVGLRAGGRTPDGEEVPYANMHETGQPSTILPRKGKFLRLPLRSALTPAGVDRYPTSIRESGAGLFYVRRAKNGKLYLFNKQDGKPWYLLVRSVRVVQRPFLAPSLESVSRQLPDRVGKAMAQAMREALR